MNESSTVTEKNMRLPAVPVEEFKYAIQLINSVIDGDTATDNPEEYAIKLPDGSTMPLDDSFSARLYLTLRKELGHLEHAYIYSITHRAAIIDAIASLNKFESYFDEKKENVTDGLIDAIAGFPLWEKDDPEQVTNRLYKFLTRAEG